MNDWSTALRSIGFEPISVITACLGGLGLTLTRRWRDVGIGLLILASPVWSVAAYVATREFPLLWLYRWVVPGGVLLAVTILVAGTVQDRVAMSQSRDAPRQNRQGSEEVDQDDDNDHESE